MNPWQAFGMMVIMQLTLLTLIAALLMRCARGRSSARHAIGVVSLLLILGSPIGVLLLPNTTGWNEVKQPHTSRPESADSTAEDRPRVHPSELPPTVLSKPARPADDRETIAEMVRFDLPLTQPSGGSAANRSGLTSALLNVMGCVWGVGVIGLGGRLLISRRRLNWIWKSSRSAAISDEVLANVREAVGKQQLPPMITSDVAPMPLVLGVSRPTVVLPTRLLTSAAADRLRDVLIHECAHVVRHDPWVHMLQQFAGLLYWPHPGVHWLNRQIAQAREEVCDNYVLQHSDAAEYSQTLLDVAEGFSHPHPALSLLGLFTRRWTLEQRISDLLNPGREIMTRTPFATVFATALILIAGSAWIGGVGAISLAADQHSPPQAAATPSQAAGTPSEPQRAAPATEKDAGERPSTSGKTPGARTGDTTRQRRDTPTGKLLDKLELQNANNSVRFTDPWLRTLKEIVDLGSDAVPELIEELDATESDMMLRSLGFTLRAIGDKRAVPALIRAFPKTLLPSSSDMGVGSDDAPLLKFAQQHDLAPDASDDTYDVGRPIREIGGALQQLTGQKLGEEQLYHVHLDGTVLQQQMKRKLFYKKAAEWARWWEEHASEHVPDPAYQHVHLPSGETEMVEPPQPDARLKTDGTASNWILQSVLDATSESSTFLDLDTGRVSALPEKWRTSGMIDRHLDEILRWASDEGFDLMGTEVAVGDGEKVFALEAIGMQAWELPKHRWKGDFTDITLKELQAEGRLSGDRLLHQDVEKKTLDPEATATFLYVTRQGNPGLLFVGVEVRDDSLQPGGVMVGDSELNPVHFHKGRRFGFSLLEELKPTKAARP